MYKMPEKLDPHKTSGGASQSSIRSASDIFLKMKPDVENGGFKGSVLVNEGVASDITNSPGQTLWEKADSFVHQNRVVVFGRTTCPFCIEVTRTLAQLGVPFTYFKVDTMETVGAELLASLKEATGQKTVPMVFINGSLVGGCDATKALIASGEFDKKMAMPFGKEDSSATEHDCEGGACSLPMVSVSKQATVELEAQMLRLQGLCLDNWLAVEDHVRPVVRRYISGPVQKKVMNDCWDYVAERSPETWFIMFPAIIHFLPMLAQRVKYLRAFIWAMPERAQQFGTMVALGVDAVNWHRISRMVPDAIPRGEPGWRHFV